MQPLQTEVADKSEQLQLRNHTMCTHVSWEPFHISIVSILLCASHQQHGIVIWCKHKHIVRKDKTEAKTATKTKKETKTNIARGTTDPGYWLRNLSYLSSLELIQVAPSGDQIWNLCNWRHLVTKFGTNASGAIWWPNFELLQVAPSGDQILN